MLCLCRLNLQYKHFSTHKKSETLTLRMKNSPPSFISMETGYLLYCRLFQCGPEHSEEQHCRQQNAVGSAGKGRAKSNFLRQMKLKRFTFYLKIGTLHTSHFVTTQMSQMVNRFTHKKGTFVQDITCSYLFYFYLFTDILWLLTILATTTEEIFLQPLDMLRHTTFSKL